MQPLGDLCLKTSLVLLFLVLLDKSFIFFYALNKILFEELRIGARSRMKASVDPDSAFYAIRRV